jgi:hypothetical protein
MLFMTAQDGLLSGIGGSGRIDEKRLWMYFEGGVVKDLL